MECLVCPGSSCNCRILEIPRFAGDGLAAKDASGEYSFRAIGIEKPAEPMLRYKVPSRKMSRERVQKAARTVYNNPIDSFFAETGQNYFVTLQDGQPRLITHDQCSPIPYNPLELE